VQATRPALRAAAYRALGPWNRVGAEAIDDLVQDTYMTLCANNHAVLRRFSGSRPEALVAYLKTIAASVAVDYLRASTAQKRGDGKQPAPLEQAEFTADHTSQEGVERTILLRQVDGCLKRNPDVPQRDRWIFWMYYRHGLTSKAIAQIGALALTAKGVESALQRMIRQVRDCLNPPKGKSHTVPS
jgi:RNA polymerase sigma-70 factor (ECF subfamily)